MEAIRSAPELYAHAIAMEREAAERYAEFAERMQVLGHEAAAEVFDRLAGFEAEHLEALLARTRGMSLPAAASPETSESAPPERAPRILSERQALAMALEGEQRAQAFFEQVMTRADDPAVRALAREMAAEEGEHAEVLRRMLEVDLRQDRTSPAF